ncbi:hypothetical protein [Rubripirellula reticaptiva]|uniref:Uncharacterized protein n=1 Tax=Rubripirellula reticaptiva TaxID=2528013 RepID=A0A5C6EK74_9BACT|nr:hypothetical protein [Rubripirellula reticaptiva]TWU48021.1 hypothetical protein Poly59_48650 [Rubripirellula reticaptiva]
MSYESANFAVFLLVVTIVASTNVNAQSASYGPAFPSLVFNPIYYQADFDTEFTHDSTFNLSSTVSPDVRVDDVYDEYNVLLGRVTVSATYSGGTSGALANGATNVTLVKAPDVVEAYGNGVYPDSSMWEAGTKTKWVQEKSYTGVYALRRSFYDPYSGAYTVDYIVNGTGWIFTAATNSNFTVYVP